MGINEITNKIESAGYITVIFEPAFYDKNLFKKNELKAILEKSQVSLRGWNFPHIPIRNGEDSYAPYSIGDGIEFFTDWGNRVTEIFRFYQSGQFLAKIALLEDTIGEDFGSGLKKGKSLDFLRLIYEITEIVLFIKNLIENAPIEGGKLIIELNKTKDRELGSFFRPDLYVPWDQYFCRIDNIRAEQSFDRTQILTGSTEISREIIKSIFNDFNWTNYSDSMIKTHQENLLNRRI
jgi:hypothetical protein